MFMIDVKYYILKKFLVHKIDNIKIFYYNQCNKHTGVNAMNIYCDGQIFTNKDFT